MISKILLARAARSWFGMRASIFRAAGFLYGSEFHQFNTGVIGIVEIELPFAAAADFGLFGAAPTVCAELLFSSVNIGNAESDVVRHAERSVVCIGGDIQHVFDPVGAVGNLHVDPVGFIVLSSALPVKVEAVAVFVEMVFRFAVAHHEANMNQTNGFDPGYSLCCVCLLFQETDAVSFGIIQRNKIILLILANG